MADQTQQPTVVIIAGPNGSGKTTFAKNTHDSSPILGEWINADEIAQVTYGDWDDREAIIKAADEADRRRSAALQARRDFTFETVLSTPDKLDFLRACRSANYHIKAHFIATRNPSINAARVMARVKKGGHSVPMDKILSRYHKSLANLATLIDLSDHVEVYDNSADWIPPRLVITFQGDLLYRINSQPIPAWVTRSINHHATSALETVSDPTSDSLPPQGNRPTWGASGRRLPVSSAYTPPPPTTIGELMSWLSEYPPETPVFIPGYEQGLHSPTKTNVKPCRADFAPDHPWWEGEYADDGNITGVLIDRKHIQDCPCDADPSEREPAP